MELEKKLDLITVEFYKKMINNKQKRDFYRIAYYLYFLKKENINIFKENFIQTNTGIYWPDNEQLMLKIVMQDDLSFKDYKLLGQEDIILIDDIYNKYKGYSLTKLKNLVKDDIKTVNLFNELSFDQQLNIIMERINNNPLLTQKLLNKIESEKHQNHQKIYKIS